MPLIKVECPGCGESFGALVRDGQDLGELGIPHCRRCSILKIAETMSDDRYRCNDCGEEFVEDGSMICPNCEGGDLIEVAEFYRLMSEELGMEEDPRV